MNCSNESSPLPTHIISIVPLNARKCVWCGAAMMIIPIPNNTDYRTLITVKPQAYCKYCTANKWG